MKKGAVLLLIILLTFPIALADIAITTDQQIYNLGNKIKGSASVLQANNFEGLIKLSISCDAYELEYFVTPVSLEADFRTAVNVPEISATLAMLGNCEIKSDLVDYEFNIVDSAQSKVFDVTNELIVLPVNSRITALPGETLYIVGVVNEAHGNNVLKALTEVTLDNRSYEIDAIDGRFNLSLETPDNIKSGKHLLEIKSSDSKGNSGASRIYLDTIPVPNYIRLDVNTSKVQPGAEIGITALLYDQADELINTSLELVMTSSSGNKVFTKTVYSSEKINYEFGQYAQPGLYNLISTYENLKSTSSINVTTIREVKIMYKNESVLIENIGNVVFDDEIAFTLESADKYFSIIRKIKLEPGKIIDMDLSKEVPQGIYDVILNIKEGLKPLADKIDQSIQGLAVQDTSELFHGTKGLLADDVIIHDNRPLYKRIINSLESISSAIVGSEGLIVRNPLIAPIALIIIILVIVVRYGRKPLVRLFRRKKDDGQ